MPKSISNLTGFVRRIAGTTPSRSEIIVFRGHSDEAYRLIPSALRSNRSMRREHLYVRELVAEHPQEFASDSTMLERLARMQHYALPTRLLDLTSNPLVALYFACRDDPRRRGEVVVLTISKKDIKYYDSDTASCIANLAQLTPREKNGVDFGLGRQAFNDRPEVKRLVQFIREEKPYFDPNIRPRDLQRALFVKPKFNSRRIAAQAGAFLLFGLRGSLDDEPDPLITVDRISVAPQFKKSILRELGNLGFNEGTLFPEIESAARHIRSRV